METAVIGAFLAGSAFGSFANVVIQRVPKGGSIFRPSRSECPRCAATIAWYDNIPLLSYIVLGGRCRRCGDRISMRYPVVEAIVALAWVAVFLRLGFSGKLAAYLLFAGVLAIVSAIDLEHHRIPNRVLAPSAGAGVALLLSAALFGSEPGNLRDAALGVAAYGVPMLAIALVVPRGMGMGDVKFAMYLGLHLGYLSLPHVLLGAFCGFLLGGAGGIALMAARRKGRKDPVPFGPFMAAGAMVSLLAGRPILRLWLGI